ncbi:MAG: hypothetical protein H9533_00910 [Rhodobacteraceae bacterium]|nr:hypothetical protein [Paracoccaceae bacterium]
MRVITGHRILPVLLLGLLSGCAGGIPAHHGERGTLGTSSASREMVRLTPAQECAVGYDLAQQIYETVSVNGTPIRLARSAGGCSRHAAEYLRRAGFAVTENATGKDQFGISTFMAESGEGSGGGFIAVARLPGFVVTRAYRPGDGGVYALSPVSVRMASGER